MSAGTERERKFLVTDLPTNLAHHRHRRIRQGYLVIDPAGPEARLRRITNGKRHAYVLTVKHPADDADVRTVSVVALTRAQLAKDWPRTKRQRLEKTRYDLAHGRYIIEVDVYHGPLAGLTVAEVEFPSAKSARSFSPPTWMSRDVSHAKPYGNKSLARNGLPKGFRHK
jgi:adenylate cyclase